MKNNEPIEFVKRKGIDYVKFSLIPMTSLEEKRLINRNSLKILNDPKGQWMVSNFLSKSQPTEDTPTIDGTNSSDLLWKLMSRNSGFLITCSPQFSEKSLTSNFHHSSSSMSGKITSTVWRLFSS
jgi:hypothetical protein